MKDRIACCICGQPCWRRYSDQYQPVRISYYFCRACRMRHVYAVRLSYHLPWRRFLAIFRGGA